MKKRLLILLQNCYDKNKLKEGWDPCDWWEQFGSSKAYETLKKVLPDERDWSIFYENANPDVEKGSTSNLKPDIGHVVDVISIYSPDLILACGKQAETAAREVWDGDLYVIPHPAYTGLNLKCLEVCKRLIEKREGKGRLAFRNNEIVEILDDS